jgi:hypothetical protein
MTMGSLSTQDNRSKRQKWLYNNIVKTKRKIISYLIKLRLNWLEPRGVLPSGFST